MSEAGLRALLPDYGLPEDAPLACINLSENAIWRAGEGEGAIILRVHRAGYHDRSEIASELQWLRALQSENTLRCVRPRAARNGEWIRQAGGRYVAAFEPIDGREPKVADDLAGWFAALGAITARLHDHARQWDFPDGFVRKRWDAATILGPCAHWGDWHTAPGLSREGRVVLERVSTDLAARLEDYGTDADTFGLVHADLRLSNLLIDPEGLWAIDFDDCGFSWWMFDFAAAVSFIETDPRMPDLANRWAVGYREVNELSARDEAMLPVFVMLRRMQLTAWLGTRADSDTADEFGGPDFTAGTVRLGVAFLERGPADLWVR